jgi:hypothetical protein
MYISKRLGTAAAVLCFLWLIAGSSTRAMASAYPTVYSCPTIPAYGSASDEAGPISGVENAIVSTSSTRNAGCTYSKFANTGIGCYLLTVDLNVDEVGGLATMGVSYSAEYSDTGAPFIATIPTYNPARSISQLLVGNADPTSVSIILNVRKGSVDGSEAEIDVNSITLTAATGCTNVPSGGGGCTDLMLPSFPNSVSDPSSLWADMRRGQINRFENATAPDNDIVG